MKCQVCQHPAQPNSPLQPVVSYQVYQARCSLVLSVRPDPANMNYHSSSLMSLSGRLVCVRPGIPLPVSLSRRIYEMLDHQHIIFFSSQSDSSFLKHPVPKSVFFAQPETLSPGIHTHSSSSPRYVSTYHSSLARF